MHYNIALVIVILFATQSWAGSVCPGGTTSEDCSTPDHSLNEDTIKIYRLVSQSSSF
ncbi:hypothetical protein PGT21_030307 [Puccinia graminis f. sp. tritici]|uniref:Uncharacterized protein n=1 Tax=Puccinia graminis f. sp. tritici TaxID=56615 RepID=A0A5B0PGJ4_PUCGR|nr:hypothetical protein PGT21_030307 [Puccinia graminis f. sp. tritici]KAA1120684.1 hypothetical protein PGTUg99_022730 [Puccinia graminis f. sp. tritici]